MKDWIKIYSSSQLALASMIVDVLNQQEVPAKLLDRKDSAYVFLGEAEVYVPTEFVAVAREILKSLELDTLEA
jgi:Putative prokaryotic signal transducing protein